MCPRRPAARASAPFAAALAAAALAACGSSPMPRMPPLVPSRIASTPAPAPAPAATAAPDASAPAASAAPAAASAPVAPLESNPFESAAVAARFPDPSPLPFTLPSLAAGGAFTSAEALEAVLREVAATRPATPAGNPTSIALVSLGASQGGVPLQALVYTRHAAATPAIIVRGGRPTVLLVGQQHGNEPAGAEALLVVARQLADGPLQHLLDRVNVVILPRANPDGAALGQAALRNGVDLDTDHLLVTTPEARAVARLARDYRPLLVVDVREYPVDAAYAARLGGVPRADLQVQYAGTARVPEFVSKASEEWFRQPLLAAMQPQGYAVEWAHRLAPDGRGAAMGGPEPTSVRNTNGLRNAVSFSLESRGGNFGRTHLARRVASQVAALTALLDSAAQRADDLVKLRKYVDASVRADLCTGEMPLDPRLATTDHALVLLDPATGADIRVPLTWESSLSLRDSRKRSRPCGYWLSADQTDAVSRLRALGLRVEQLSEAVDMQADINTGTPVPGEREILEFSAAAGSYYVPLSQPWGNLVVAALEPDAAQGFLAARVVTGPSRLRKVTVVPKVRRTLVP